MSRKNKTAGRRKTGSRKKKKPARIFRFQLTLAGITGIGVVVFCIFLWMFLLGIWAGQTILLPTADTTRKTAAQVNRNKGHKQSIRIRTLVASGKKEPGSHPAAKE